MDRRPRIRVAASQLMSPRTSFEDDVIAVRQEGYEGIGLFRDKLLEFGVEKAIEMLDEFGLSVSSLQWAGGFTGDEVQSYESCVADAIQLIEAAAALRAGCLVVHSGSRAGHTRPHSWRLFNEAMRRLLPHAERLGVVLGIEPMDPAAGQRWSIAESVPDLLTWVEELDSPHVKLVFDNYHICRNPDWPLWLERHRSRICLIHLADAKDPPSDEQNRCLLGTGNLPLESFLEKLGAIGYDGYLELELFGQELEGQPFHEILAHSRSVVRSMIA